MTWLLAAICGWALLLLIAVATGLGNRFPTPTVPAPPALVAPALLEARGRLGSFDDYNEVGARPLLNADRRPSPIAASSDGSGADLDVALTSVLLTPTLKLAILTGKDGTSYRVRLGESVRGSAWTLTQLEPRRAVLAGPSGQRTLDLRVYDGGGAPGKPPGNSEPDPSAQTDNPDSTDVPETSVASTNPASSTATPAANPSAQAVTQARQIEAIRRRIEARRAQMRAAAAANDGKDNQ